MLPEKSLSFATCPDGYRGSAFEIFHRQIHLRTNLANAPASSRYPAPPGKRRVSRLGVNWGLV